MSVGSKPAQPAEYLFIDNARFISMFVIVMRHCALFEFNDSHLSLLERSIIEFRSFGIIIFFVNGGFLMADWLARAKSDVRAYWRTRVERVAKPWLIWAGAYTLVDLAKHFYLHRIVVAEVPEKLWQNVFAESYWFVPVLLFSLVIMLSLRRFWHSSAFGVLLMVLSGMHGVNQYTHWFPPGHTVAFFGYLFYLWLGIWMFQHFAAVVAWIHRVPWWLVLAALGVAGSLMIVEDQVLLGSGSITYYNALELSTQLYGLVVLLVLVKVPVRLVPAFIDVRRETYGIYLSHQLVASICRGAIDLILGLPESGETFFGGLRVLVQNPAARIAVWFGWFGLIYTLSLLLTKLLCRTRLAWIVGAKKRSNSVESSG